jgi:hypothetical protein
MRTYHLNYSRSRMRWPALAMRAGLPYSVVNQGRDFVGPRDTLRLPGVNALDLQVTRPIAFPFPKELKARIGFTVFNLLNHLNLCDVQDDINSHRFGALFNGVGRTFRGKFVLEF